MSENIISPQPNYTAPNLNSAKRGFLSYINAIFAAVTPKQLTKGVKVSTTIHLSLLIFAIIAPLIMHHRYRPFAPTVHTVQLVNMPGSIAQSSGPSAQPVISQPPKQEIQKPKAEPKKTEQEPAEKPIQQKPKMMTPSKKEPKIAPKEKTPTLEERLEKRLNESDGKNSKDTQKKWRDADNISATKNTADNNSSELEGTIFSGSLGNSGSLGVAGPSDFPFQWYLELIHGKISSCWNDPQTLLDKQNTAIISFTITKTGEVTNIYTKKSSGAQSFDQSGIKAIELAKPFPQLPAGCRDSELIVNVEFNLEK